VEVAGTEEILDNRTIHQPDSRPPLPPNGSARPRILAKNSTTWEIGDAGRRRLETCTLSFRSGSPSTRKEAVQAEVPVDWGRRKEKNIHSTFSVSSPVRLLRQTRNFYPHCQLLEYHAPAETYQHYQLLSYHAPGESCRYRTATWRSNGEDDDTDDWEHAQQQGFTNGRDYDADIYQDGKWARYGANPYLNCFAIPITGVVLCVRELIHGTCPVRQS
jgi:hypothetical protein